MMAYVTETVTGEKQLKTGQNTKETKYLGGNWIQIQVPRYDWETADLRGHWNEIHLVFKVKKQQ